YTNLNQQQSDTVTEVAKGKRGDRDDEDDGDGGGSGRKLLLRNARVAPIHIGPSSTGTVEEYSALADAAVHTVGSSPNDIRVFAGQRDDGFYVDVMGNFDLLNLRNPGVDTVSELIVHTIAIVLQECSRSATC